MKMIWLASLLIKDKWRRLVAQFGSAGCASFGAMLVLLGSVAALTAARLLPNASQQQILGALNDLWCAWVTVGVFLGKDLTWQISFERLKLFPLGGFLRVWIFGFVMSFLTLPIVVFLISAAIFAARADVMPVLHMTTAVIASVFFIASVHLIVSLGRSLVCRNGGLSTTLKTTLSTVLLATVGFVAVDIFRPGVLTLLPGRQLGAILAGPNLFEPILRIAAVVCCLGICDFFAQRQLAYSGISGPPVQGLDLGWGGRFLAARPSWPPTLWRISLLGWLRNFNVALLLFSGALYGFFFIYLTKAEEALDFILFGAMVLIFHSYIRGNLLGVDHGGVWLYYLFPAPVENALRAKNQTLSVIQSMMVLAVFAPALLHPVSSMDFGSWMRVISNAYCTIVVGEICGSFFSVRYPEPIERSSHFSGGMSVGGLCVPLLQILCSLIFLAVTGLTRGVSAIVVFWLEVISIPAVLWFIKAHVLPVRIQRYMVGERRSILTKLSVFSS